IDWLTADWVRCSFSAARENFPSRVTVRNTSSCPRSMALSLNKSPISISLYYFVSMSNTNARIISFAFTHSPRSITGWQEVWRMARARITVFDTTLRDGEQSPGCSMTVQEKLRLAHQLGRLGADVIEAGFPIASEGDFAAVQAIAAVIRRPIIAGLARACTQDIERAWQALKGAARSRIHVFLATSDIHLQYKLKITRQKCLEQARDAVRLAKSLCEDVEFSPEDATGTDPEFLFQILTAVVEAGATTLNIPDTVGYTMPAEFAALIHAIRQRVKGIENVTISAHCHNDLGLAVANSLAAVEAGARQVECTINGIGERAGNASLEEIVMAMRVRPDHYSYDTGIVGEHLYRACQMLSEITGVPVQP